jgi:hypothetical protein
MKYLVVTLAVIAMVGAFASAGVVTNVSIPFAQAVQIPCANEIVDLTGNLHILVETVTDANGGTHYKTHAQPQGVSGVGRISGDQYRATGVTQSEYHNSPLNPPGEMTFVNNFRIIGQGPGNNYLVHQLTHITLNADGTVTAQVSNVSIDCK